MPTASMEAAARDLVVSIVREHADSLLRTARRYTVCAADAEDAYQRALEVFVKSAHRLEAEGAHKWLHVVVRNEALAVRRARSSLVGVEDEAALAALDDARHVASVEERSERLDDLGRAAEALQGLKPQEVTALWLKAEGLSYREIAERQGWTYTKVNRAITEGRRAFLRRYAGIEAGEECERWSPTLAAIADGDATPRQLLEARPHLRNCPSCRASVAAMRRGEAAMVALLPPVAADGLGDLSAALGEKAPRAVASAHDGAAGAAASAHDRAAGVVASLNERAASAAASLHERAVAATMRLQAIADAMPSGKAAAVALSAAALAGGGAVAERGLGGEDARADAAAPAATTATALPAWQPSGRDRARVTVPSRPATPRNGARANAEAAPRRPVARALAGSSIAGSDAAAPAAAGDARASGAGTHAAALAAPRDAGGSGAGSDAATPTAPRGADAAAPRSIDDRASATLEAGGEFGLLPAPAGRERRGADGSP